jgi:DNA-binding transcriptional regulator YdaS (Cro superfamily)
MKTKDAIDYFGGIKELANFLGIWPHNISRWGEFVPEARAYELEVKTEGKLKAESE